MGEGEFEAWVSLCSVGKDMACTCAFQPAGDQTRHALQITKVHREWKLSPTLGHSNSPTSRKKISLTPHFHQQQNAIQNIQVSSQFPQNYYTATIQLREPGSMGANASQQHLLAKHGPDHTVIPQQL
jgi:hypothetical protein